MSLLTVLLATLLLAGAAKPLPVVLWHGMGDSCCASWSIGAIAQQIRDELGVFVHSISTGSGSASDVLSSYFGNVNDQVLKVCQQLRSIPELQDGYNAVGFSQGGQFMRAVVQRCQHTGPRASTLITMGGQHQGVATLPACSFPVNASSLDPCYLAQRVLAAGAYLPYVRNHIVQAQYFKDPYHLETYLRYNPFLPDINNEGDDKQPLYASNLASLNRLVLLRFSNDTTVHPRDSAWFYFHDGQQLIALKDQPLYKEDWIGLRQLNEAGRLDFIEAPGQHMHFTLEWFSNNIIQRYLAAESHTTVTA